jgi:Mg2+/Co2+ transporter CorC
MKKSNRLLKFLLCSPLQTSGTVVFYYYALLITLIAGVTLLLSNILEITTLQNVVSWVVTLLIVTSVVLLFRKIFPHIVEKRLRLETLRNISINDLSETFKLTAAEKKEETEILQGIVNFERISVDKIMKPRADIVGIDLKSDFEAVIRIIRESEYSRLPVYEDSIDSIKGILYIKDLLKYIDRELSFNWQPLIREAYFVSETKKIDDLLKEFQDRRIHMAIVADEFGGTLGIATLEDILEVIVGDICDEHDDEECQ